MRSFDCWSTVALHDLYAYFIVLVEALPVWK